MASRGRTACEELEPGSLAALTEALQKTELSSIESDPLMGMDWEEYWLSVGDQDVGVVIQRTPNELSHLACLLDRQFGQLFPLRYDISLCPGDG